MYVYYVEFMNGMGIRTLEYSKGQGYVTCNTPSACVWLVPGTVSPADD